ncbi:type I-F CRISPR-associated endoribonuclease Cas6/Csy4 [Photobacterium aquimaris]|uniref:type I-F CRISPR-associated endoribonuclease Cas6/Csy4 n=1 Tax=Photobacterium TaxID=657 RepID=UPI0007EF4639|nr:MULTISPECIES: type I-F CRISPR-associated endoribonuclease Cas6/Csy4 [Photobacterium]OBU17878.1 type I-F CRISPR-associated endoribonuclease Cas6/Csy4 [Photobacterium aquimaris]PSW02402.1 type I-F CRISPR-associated endoribonuclease Cas6/Csy4 [Photobacterium aquimaris]
MDSYIDIQLKPNAEMRETELSCKVFTKFHKALVKLNTNQIGISFPQAHVKLGRLFRIHGEASLLNDLEGLAWLESLGGCCRVGAVIAVPEQVQYRNISAKKSNMSNAKLRRLIKRGNLDQDGIKRYKVKMLSQGFEQPYLDLFSSSTGQIYRKFFDFSDLMNDPVEGVFDSYGLSKTATVPWF